MISGGNGNENELTKLIARVIISLILTVILTTKLGKGDINILIFLIFWIMIYAMTSVYYHVRHFINEADEQEEMKGYRNQVSLLGLLLSYVIFPIGVIALYFVGIPSLISSLVPEDARQNIRVVINIVLIVGIIIFDIKCAKDDYNIKIALNKRGFTIWMRRH